MDLPKTILEVVESFSRLPGIGEKTALRLALILSTWEKNDLEIFSKRIGEITALKSCNRCGVFSDQEVCDICLSPKRGEARAICVVESITDYLAIERSGQFQGRYHILGGVLNPLMGIGPDELGIDKMVSRFLEENVQDVILAINPSVEGDATCSYIRQQLAESVTVERIGFGVPIGGSLEYLDSMTISKALENRKAMR